MGAMHLTRMLQVNRSLQEVELADCDLVKCLSVCLRVSSCGPVCLSSLLSLQATQSVVALSIVLKSNTALRSVDISRPLLFSLQVESRSGFTASFFTLSRLT